MVTDFFGDFFNVGSSLTPDPGIQATVVDPVAASVQALATNVIAQSEVALDERRSAIRSRETNAGNLIADSQLDAAERLASSFGVNLDGDPLVSLANGGGIRTDAVVPAGDYTELQTFNSLPFGNFVAVVEDVGVDTLKLLLENAVSRTSLDPDTGRGGRDRRRHRPLRPGGRAVVHLRHRRRPADLRRRRQRSVRGRPRAGPLPRRRHAAHRRRHHPARRLHRRRG